MNTGVDASMQSKNDHKEKETNTLFIRLVGEVTYNFYRGQWNTIGIIPLR